MKKSERLNQELIFLQFKNTFHLKDIMEEFGISKRTALRDISDLENMGVSLYSKAGRYGSYYLLNKDLLAPVYFNEDEIASVLFAIQAQNLLSQTPFGKSYPQIYQKLLSTLSREKSSAIQNRLEDVSYKSIPVVARTNHLTDVLAAARNELLLDIVYEQRGHRETTVYVCDLFFQDGVWFFNGYDTRTSDWNVYRCDCIRSCSIRSSQKECRSFFPDKKSARKSMEDYNASQDTISFKCLLTASGREQFLRTNFYDMSLNETDSGDYVLSGQITERNLHYLIHYFISFGSELRIISPDMVINEYCSALKEILAGYV